MDLQAAMPLATPKAKWRQCLRQDICLQQLHWNSNCMLGRACNPDGRTARPDEIQTGALGARTEPERACQAPGRDPEVSTGRPDETRTGTRRARWAPG